MGDKNKICGVEKVVSRYPHEVENGGFNSRPPQPFNEKAIRAEAYRVANVIQEEWGGKHRSHTVLYKEHIEFLIAVILKARPTSFLEIGSYRGCSMSIIGSMMSTYCKPRLISVDPYFEHGYIEDTNKNKKKFKPSTKETIEVAKSLYDLFKLDVIIERKTSDEFFREFVGMNEIDLVFIDGDHERFHPLYDFAYCTKNMREDSFIILDDTDWLDVAPIAKLAKRNLIEIARCDTMLAVMNKFRKSGIKVVTENENNIT